MVWRDLTVKELNDLRNALVIDVRSPCEHAAERIPGSINIALLSDDERVVIGTIYKEQGEMVARRHALRIISPKIPEIVDSLAAIKTHGQSMVIHCWRGGLRSESVASVLSIAGIDCFRLTGGYKAWRQSVVSDFDNDAYPFRAVVLHGLTGVGKTDVLHELAKRGHQVLDLEALANHRGSVFGGLGKGDQPTQKNFDAVLWEQLRKLDPTRRVIMEGESRKVGTIALPDSVFHRISYGAPVLVSGSLKARAARIAADYCATTLGGNSAELKQEGLQLLLLLKERLGSERINAVRAMVERGEMEEAISILLVDYYDPLYQRQLDKHAPFEFEVCTDNPEEAAVQLEAWLERQPPLPNDQAPVAPARSSMGSLKSTKL